MRIDKYEIIMNLLRETWLWHVMAIGMPLWIWFTHDFLVKNHMNVPPLWLQFGPLAILVMGAWFPALAEWNRISAIMRANRQVGY